MKLGAALDVCALEVPDVEIPETPVAPDACSTTGSETRAAASIPEAADAQESAGAERSTTRGGVRRKDSFSGGEGDAFKVDETARVEIPEDEETNKEDEMVDETNLGEENEYRAIETIEDTYVAGVTGKVVPTGAWDVFEGSCDPIEDKVDDKVESEGLPDPMEGYQPDMVMAVLLLFSCN